MTTLIKSTDTIATPDAAMPYLEKDWGIIRGVTLSKLDFSNADCYSGAASGGNITGGTSFTNLVDGAGAGSIAGSASKYFQPLYQGCIRGNGSVSAGGYPTITPPTDFAFPADTETGLVILHAAMPASGWPVSSNIGIVGVGSGSGALTQWVLFISTSAGGAVTLARFRVRGTSGDIDCNVTGTPLADMLDGDLHQIGLAVEISDGVATLSIYLDGVVIATSSGTMSAFKAETSASLFAPSGFVQMTGASTPACRFGALSSHDLTGRPDVTLADLLARDAEAVVGYLS